MTAKVRSLTGDSEATCERCGKPFAITDVDEKRGGKRICLNCAVQEAETRLEQKINPTIGEKTITEVKRMVEEAMRTYLAEINDAYLGEADALSLKFGVKLSPAKSGTAIDLSFGFVTGRIKDKFIAYADEKQLSMFPQEEGKEI